MMKPKPHKLRVQFVRTPNPTDEAIFLMLQLIDQKERKGESAEKILRWVKSCLRNFQTRVLPPTKARA
jgi:hypothetical protein